MKNVFLRYLGTYILILFLPLLLGWAIYEVVLKEFEGYIKNTHLSLLNQTKEIIDRYTNEIEWRVFQIANNANLKSLVYQDKKQIENNIFIIREIVNELGTYIIYSSNINTTFYIYLKNLDLIITPNASYQLADFLRGEIFIKIEGMTAQQWHENSIVAYYPGIFFPARRMIIEDFGKVAMEKMVPYIQSLPLGYNKSPEDIIGVIQFFILEEEFTALLNNINIPLGGWAYIADQASSILTGISNNTDGIVPIEFNQTEKEGLKKISIADKEMFVIFTTSSKNNWKYIAVLPSRFVLDKVRIIQILSFIVILAAALVSVFISSVIAYKRAKPIKKIIGLLKNSVVTNTKGDLYKMDVLSGSISKLIDTSKDMQDQLKEQMKFVRSAFFNNLLNGYFRNAQEMNFFLSYAGIVISEKKFIVVLLNLTGFESLASIGIIEELHKVKIIVKNTFEQVSTQKIFFYDIDERRIAVITALTQDDTTEIKRRLNAEINTFFDETSKFSIGKPRIGIGNMCENLMDINNSYEQAKEALDYLVKTGNDHIAWFSDVHKQTQDYYFPLELELRLLNAIKAGDKEQVENIFNTLYNENIKKRRLLSEKLREFLNEMHGTLNKAKIHVPVEESNIKIDITEPVDLVFKKLQTIFFDICHNINLKKRSHNNKLIKRIITHLMENYKDTNLCLYSVSSQFSITESYLSFFFKEQTGTNFSFFLEKIRIDDATGLLDDPGLSIKKIAHLVGYNSDKTFRRVFKRVKGVSPSNYRQQRKINKSTL